MKFYTEIAQYYDDIFPLNEAQVTFFKNRLGIPPKQILDVACGTGSLLTNLCSYGYQGVGIDLNDTMIRKAEEKGCKNCIFKVSDMLTFQEGSYDLIYCIGNSLVHLNNLEDIKRFLTNCKAMLNQGGIFVTQIINYNRILKDHITSLPLIKNEAKNLTFIREYAYNNTTHLINFTTTLKVYNNTFHNTVNLYPLTSEELVTLLKQVGFTHIKLYGDFKETSYNPHESYSLVVEAYCV